VNASTGVTDPFLVEGPALVSFSGGQTSGYMLWRIIQSHGGTLPDDVIVAFANTGKEREETLRFVHECETRWGVRIHWLEYIKHKGPLDERFMEVGYNSANRNGAPFERLIAAKKYTPNSAMRFCTSEMKVSLMENFCKSTMGWAAWKNIVGLRYDEGHRALKVYARNADGKNPWQTVLPLDKSRITKTDVAAFWNAQPFDLGLKSYEGNCDLCFLKGRNKLKAIIREQPGVADWWISQEKISKGRFVTEYSYADLKREVEQQPHLFDELDDEQDFDAECGLTCATEGD